MKKDENSAVATSLNFRSFLLLLLVLGLAFGLYFVYVTYIAVPAEAPIKVTSPTELEVAQQKLQEQTQKIDEDLGGLRELLS